MISPESGPADPVTAATIEETADAMDEPMHRDGVPAEQSPTPVPSSSRHVSRAVREWVLVIAGALVVALVIRTFLFQAYEIPSPSMVDTLQVGDRVLVNKLSYRLHDIHRGDVVVFKRPPGEPDPTIHDLIKRVIGLPGETLEFKECGVYVGGQALVETYTEDQCTDPPQSNVDPDGDHKITVPAGSIFVMGDNRGGSFDSRYFGPITEKSVVGRAFVIMWPIGRWAWL